jgi:hypothetical protein
LNGKVFGAASESFLMSAAGNDCNNVSRFGYRSIRAPCSNVIYDYPAPLSS